MTERQVKIRMTKLEKLTNELEFLKNAGSFNTKYADEIKEKINKIQKELTEDTTSPIYPAFLYDVESGSFTPFSEKRG